MSVYARFYTGNEPIFTSEDKDFITSKSVGRIIDVTIDKSSTFTMLMDDLEPNQNVGYELYNGVYQTWGKGFVRIVNMINYKEWRDDKENTDEFIIKFVTIKGKATKKLSFKEIQLKRIADSLEKEN